MSKSLIRSPSNMDVMLPPVTMTSRLMARTRSSSSMLLHQSSIFVFKTCLIVFTFAPTSLHLYLEMKDRFILSFLMFFNLFDSFLDVNRIFFQDANAFCHALLVDGSEVLNIRSK